MDFSLVTGCARMIHHLSPPRDISKSFLEAEATATKDGSCSIRGRPSLGVPMIRVMFISGLML